MHAYTLTRVKTRRGRKAWIYTVCIRPDPAGAGRAGLEGLPHPGLRGPAQHPVREQRHHPARRTPQRCCAVWVCGGCNRFAAAGGGERGRQRRDTGRVGGGGELPGAVLPAADGARAGGGAGGVRRGGGRGGVGTGLRGGVRHGSLTNKKEGTAKSNTHIYSLRPCPAK